MNAGQPPKIHDIKPPKISLRAISLLAIVIQVVAVLLLIGPGERFWNSSATSTVTPDIPVVTDASALRTPQVERAGSPIVLVDTSATSAVTATAIPTPVLSTSSHDLPATATSAPPATATPGQVTATVVAPTTVEPEQTASHAPARTTATPTLPTLMPTVMPTATETPTPVRVVDRIIEAETTLRSGVLEAVLDYGDGPDSSVRLTFDLGEGDSSMRMQLVSRYPGQNGIQTVERIVIGRQAWQKTADGKWGEIAEQEGVWGQIQNYLPRIATADMLYTIDNPTPGIVSWHDDARDIDVTLFVDPETGVPAKMEQRSRGTGTVAIVTYVSWSEPVTIEPPTGQ
jgi:hypothetical protein